MPTRKSIEEIAQKLAKQLARSDKFHEDLEPGEVAWILRNLVKKVKWQQRVIDRLNAS